MVTRAERNEYKGYIECISDCLDQRRLRDWQVVFESALTICPDADKSELYELWKYGLQKCNLKMIDSISYNTVLELWAEILETK